MQSEIAGSGKHQRLNLAVFKIFVSSQFRLFSSHRAMMHFFPPQFFTLPPLAQNSLFPQTPLSFSHLSKYCSDKNPNLS